MPCGLYLLKSLQRYFHSMFTSVLFREAEASSLPCIIFSGYVIVHFIRNVFLFTHVFLMYLLLNFPVSHCVSVYTNPMPYEN
jgi:hypothetical protein